MAKIIQIDGEYVDSNTIMYATDTAPCNVMFEYLNAFTANGIEYECIDTTYADILADGNFIEAGDYLINPFRVKYIDDSGVVTFDNLMTLETLEDSDTLETNIKTATSSGGGGGLTFQEIQRQIYLQ